MLFGILHLSFAALFVVGLASLRFARLRIAYVTVATVGMCLLPVQHVLVNEGRLTCDTF